MDRLTVPDKMLDGRRIVAIIDAREVREHATTIYWALKKYEDTGLTPEEITVLKDRNEPKKPIKHLEDDGADCPICGLTVCFDGLKHGDFCRNCGQAIDWSEQKKEHPHRLGTR